jgi:hypothetical protein
VPVALIPAALQDNPSKSQQSTADRLAKTQKNSKNLWFADF